MQEGLRHVDEQQALLLADLLQHLAGSDPGQSLRLLWQQCSRALATRLRSPGITTTEERGHTALLVDDMNLVDTAALT